MPTTPPVQTVRQMFDTQTHDALCAYIRDCVPMLSVRLDDTLFMRRYIHGGHYLRDIHHQMTAAASGWFGEDLQPSYVFLSMYGEGGRCPLHIDRPQCYRTIDYLITQEQDDPWLLRISDPMADEQRAEIWDTGTTRPATDDEIAHVIASQRWTDVLLEPNDAVLYSGTHQWHYRPEPSRGPASLVFFHFVPVGFEGPLD